MKKLWICLIVSLFLAACSSDSGDGTDGNNTGNDGGSSGGGGTGGGGDTGGGTGGGGDTGGGTGGGTDDDPPDFGQPNSSQIRPGVVVQAMGSQCTTNFIYTDGSGNYFIGAAAHCFSPDTNSGIDACEARNEALGIPVEIENAAFAGSLAYTSWQTMQDAGETPGSDICTSNDFALVRIDPRDVDNIHPAARVFEGPTGLFEGNASSGDDVFSYGQATPFSFAQAKSGTIASQGNSGWTYFVDFDTPSAPGDSGSAVLHESGQALGVLSGLSVCIGICLPASTSVVNLAMAMDYANDKAFNAKLELVTWPNFTP